MAHHIVLVRHERAAPSAGADLLRPLTDVGERQALEQGERLRDLVKPTIVLSSPATRCLQTAHGLLEGMGRTGEPTIHGDLVDTAPARSALAVASAAPDGAIIVGHQPNLVDVACLLLRSTALPFAMPPATAVLLSRDDPSQEWSIARVLPAP